MAKPITFNIGAPDDKISGVVDIPQRKSKATPDNQALYAAEAWVSYIL